MISFLPSSAMSVFQEYFEFNPVQTKHRTASLPVTFCKTAI